MEEREVTIRKKKKKTIKKWQQKGQHQKNHCTD